MKYPSRFVTAIALGFILGAVGALVALNDIDREPQTRPKAPPNAIPKEFNGDTYYIVPLSNYADK